MSVRNLLGVVLLCLVLLVSTQPARADGITFTLVSADLTGTPGSTLTWQYDVTNTSGQSIFANTVDATPAFTGGTADSSVFDFFFPLPTSDGSIPTGTSLIGTLYSFVSDPTVSNSFNSGVFDLSVILADGTSVDLSANYTATIAPAAAVPEPRTVVLLALGLVALVVGRKLF
jgi:hypothetical protein